MYIYIYIYMLFQGIYKSMPWQKYIGRSKKRKGGGERERKDGQERENVCRSNWFTWNERLNLWYNFSDMHMCVCVCVCENINKKWIN